MTDRMDKINEIVKHEVAKSIHELMPDLFVSVTRVNVSKDLSYAKIWISAVKDAERTVKLIQSDSHEIKNLLAHSLILRKVPSLHFVPDTTGESGQKIDQLLDQLKRDKQL